MTIPTTHDIPRHGWPDPDRCWWQGAAPWGQLPYGHGGRTIAQWGCTLVTIAAAARLAGVKASADPVWLHARAMRPGAKVWAPDSSLAVLPALARAAELTCPDVADAWTIDKMTPLEMSRAICDAIDHHGIPGPKGFGWLHVDYTGDDRGEHWILALAYDDVSIHCYDSAVAGMVALDRHTLRGTAMWGRRKRSYRVVRGYPLGV